MTVKIHTYNPDLWLERFSEATKCGDFITIPRTTEEERRMLYDHPEVVELIIIRHEPYPI